MLAVAKVPRMPIRLRSIMFRDEFDGRIENVQKELDTFQKGCKVIETSDSFKSFLGIAVSISNALNAVSRCLINI